MALTSVWESALDEFIGVCCTYPVLRLVTDIPILLIRTKYLRAAYEYILETEGLMTCRSGSVDRGVQSVHQGGSLE